MKRFRNLRNVDLEYLLLEDKLVEEGLIAPISINKDIFNLDINDRSGNPSN